MINKLEIKYTSLKSIKQKFASTSLIRDIANTEKDVNIFINKMLNNHFKMVARQEAILKTQTQKLNKLFC